MEDTGEAWKYNLRVSFLHSFESVPAVLIFLNFDNLDIFLLLTAKCRNTLCDVVQRVSEVCRDFPFNDANV